MLIIGSYFKDVIGKIKLRRFNYSCNDYQQKITLSHPECLTAVLLVHMSITNLNECVNLDKLASYNIRYKPNDISQFTKLTTFTSFMCEYDGADSCMVEELMRNNKL